MTTQYPPLPPDKNNKGLVIGLIAVVTVLVLVIVGVGAWLIFFNDDDEPAPTPPVAEQPPLPDGPTAPPADQGGAPPTNSGGSDNPGGYTDQQYVDAVEQTLNIDYNDADLITVGKNICSAIDQYGADTYVTSMQEVADKLQITIGELAVITQAAIYTYCPEYA